MITDNQYVTDRFPEKKAVMPLLKLLPLLLLVAITFSHQGHQVH